MNWKIFFMFAVFLMLPLVSAEVYKVGDNVTLAHSVRVDGEPLSTIDCNITIRNPDDLALVRFSPMINNLTSEQHTFFLFGPVNTSLTGTYPYDITCSNATLYETQSFEFEVNPSGKEYIPEISGPLLFGAIISLIFLSLFLFLLANKIELFPMKLFLLILSGLIAIANIAFITGSFKEFFSTSSALSTSFGGIYILFIVLLMGASIFLLMWALLVAVRLWNVNRGMYERSFS